MQACAGYDLQKQNLPPASRLSGMVTCKMMNSCIFTSKIEKHKFFKTIELVYQARHPFGSPCTKLTKMLPHYVSIYFVPTTHNRSFFLTIKKILSTNTSHPLKQLLSQLRITFYIYIFCFLIWELV